MNDPQTIDSLLKDLPELCTTQEIAALLRVEPQTVLKWTSQEGGLQDITFGNRARRVRRFRKEDLREYLLRSDED